MTTNTINTILIPTSRYVDKEMQLEVGKIPPVLIPVSGKPLLKHIVDRFTSLPEKCSFYLIVNEGKEMIEEYLQSLEEGKDLIHLLDVPLSEDLGEALHTGLKQIPLTEESKLIINFGDTLIDSNVNTSSNGVFYVDLNESFRWTTFTSEEGKIVKITDKFASDHTASSHVFCGLFVINNPSLFRKCLEDARTVQAKGKFYTGLESYLKGVDYNIIKVDEWFDFGHVDNYYNAKRNSINRRFFNELKIDEHRPVITKTSKNIEKFVGEISWYLEIPAPLKCYIPQIFDYSLRGRGAYVKMEYYGYPSLSDLYLFGGHNLGIWNYVLDGVFRLIEEMKTYQIHDNQSSIEHALRDMYITKTLERLTAVEGHQVLGRLFQSSATINGTRYAPLKEYINSIPELVESCLIPGNTHLNVIHGDLCLSNILFDPKSRIIKVIDPRGRFGEYSIYGDFRYDLAKLSHSFNGHYESIVNDKFFLLHEDDNITYSFHLSDYQHKVSDMFNHRLDKAFSVDRKCIDLIEALLFLSMVPLHADHLGRQILMLCRGWEKLGQFKSVR